MGQAQSANLLNRPPWKSYPDRMLQMRARGFALRDAFADVIGGLITSEEAEDYPVAKNAVQELGNTSTIDKGARSVDDIVKGLSSPDEAKIDPDAIVPPGKPEHWMEWVLTIPGKPPLR